MIFSVDLCVLPEYSLQKKREATISILHLCADSTLKKTLDKIEHFPPKQNWIEHILVYQNSAGCADLPNLSSDIRTVFCGNNLEIPALSFNLGLIAASGNWIWAWEPETIFSTSDILETMDVLDNTNSSSHLVWLQPPGDPTREGHITINEICNGLCPSPDSLIWRADIFDRWGCFDPHLAIRDAFVYEMLLRTARHLRIAELPTRDGTPAVYAPERARDVVLYTDSCTQTPSFVTLPEYAMDDLSGVERKHGSAVAWRLYLDRILPYYYQQRHLFPPGLFISPQSQPRARLTALFTKVQYETSNELTFWNYERRFSGARRVSYSYLQSELLRSNVPFNLGQLGKVDVLVSTRTADDFNTELIAQANQRDCATAYMLDDDLLTFHEYGGNFADFKPGSAYYEAMVEAIRSADVVIGFSDQIERSVAPLNKRYIHCEDSVPLECLPSSARKTANQVFRFGYAGSGYRTAEFEMLRPAIERISAEYGDALRFSFWGMDASTLNIKGNVEYVPFSAHYLEYLERLSQANFDAMLVPLMLEPSPKKAKNPNKFMETAIANAVGLFSDVPSYQVVQHAVTGFKVAENTEAWYQAMKMLIEMPAEQRAQIRSNALAYVRTFFSTPALAATTETGLIAAQLHQQTRAKRLDDGRPLVAYFFPSIAGTGGGEIQLWRRLELARQLGLRVLVVISSLWASQQDAERVSQFLDARGIEYEFVPYNAFFTTPYDLDIMPSKPELDAMRDFWTRRGGQIALAHSLAFVPAVGQTCAEFGIPHLASIYGIDDAYEFPNGALPFKYCDLIQSDSLRYAKKWAKMLKCEWVCARENVPAEIYDVGFEKLYVNPTALGERIHVSLIGTFMPRKSHLETIQSLACLSKEILRRIELHLYGGVDVHPEYGKACREARRKVEALGAQVEFHGHVTDIAQVYRQSDIVLSVSTLESFPSTIKESTAGGCLVIASQAGGIAEMMVDDVNCFLIDDVTPQAIATAITRAISTDAERALQIRRNAYALAVEEFHPRRTLHDLALCYNQCIALARPKPLAPPVVPPAVAPEERDYTRVALGSGLQYQVTPAHRDWIGLDVRVEQPDNAQGVVMLRVALPDGRVLREAAVDLASVSSPRWLEFRFHPIANSAGMRFVLTFTPQNDASHTGLKVYENSLGGILANAFCYQMRYAG